jgi:hypothetical protein
MKNFWLAAFFLFSTVLAIYAGGQKGWITSQPLVQSSKEAAPVKPTPAQIGPRPASDPAISPSHFYTGNGGKGVSLAILAPKATGLEESQGYIPTLVQGEFVSNFSGYSAISVMDRENMDNVYAELLSGYYDDDDETGHDLGHLTATDYIMNGSITKTTTGYALQMKITKTADKMTMASYSGTCTFEELDNLTGVRRASLDMLQKMGVTLTERARMELAGAGKENYVNAQTALARGITAQKNGSTVAALTYYNETARFSYDLPEAKHRLASLTQNIQSGNIAENIRTDFQRREAWKTLLTEAVEFYSQNPIFDVVINPQPSQGETDYDKGTVDLEYEMFLAPNAGFKSLFTILVAYWDTGKAADWKLDDLIDQLVPVDYVSQTDPICIEVHAELIDVNNIRLVAGRTERSPNYRGGVYVRTTYSSIYPSFVLNRYRSTVRDSSRAWPRPWSSLDCIGPLEVKTLIFTVDANTISENMSVRLVGIQYASHINRYGYGAIITTGCISSGLSMEQYFKNDKNFTKVMESQVDLHQGSFCYRFR